MDSKLGLRKYNVSKRRHSEACICRTCVVSPPLCPPVSWCQHLTLPHKLECLVVIPFVWLPLPASDRLPPVPFSYSVFISYLSIYAPISLSIMVVLYIHVIIIYYVFIMLRKKKESGIVGVEVRREGREPMRAMERNMVGGSNVPFFFFHYVGCY